jgi:hypothetical protein
MPITSKKEIDENAIEQIVDSCPIWADIQKLRK